MYYPKLIRAGSKLIRCRMIHSMCEKPDPNINLTIFGNMIPTVRIVAMLLKQCVGLDEIRLYGVDNKVCSTAIDLAQLDTNTVIKGYKGDTRLMKEAIVDSKVILICGGFPEKPLDDEVIFERNVSAVKNIVMNCIEVNPQAILLLATPPINSLVPMISEEYKRENVYDPKKIIGLSTLSTIIGNSLIGKYLKCNPIQVHCPIIGGDSERTRVPILSQCTPSLDSVPEEERVALYNTIVQARTSCLKVKHQEGLGPMYLAEAFGITRFITNLVNAMRGTEEIYECAYVRQTGHIKSFLPYMQSIIRLGPDGVAGSFMPKITQWEVDQLLRAYIHLKNDIHVGSSVVTGEMEQTKQMGQVASCNLHEMSSMLGQQQVGDVVVDFSKKYKNLEIYP